MLKLISKKLIVFLLIITIFIVSFGIYESTSAWSVLPTAIITKFGLEEIKSVILDTLKKMAMVGVRKLLKNLIGEKGGIIGGDVGEFIYATADRAAVDYIDNFFSNCINIDANIKLAIEAKYEPYVFECPIVIGGGENTSDASIDFTKPGAWQDWQTYLSGNNEVEIYFKASALAEAQSARKQSEQWAEIFMSVGGYSRIKDSEGNVVATGGDVAAAVQATTQATMDIGTQSQSFMASILGTLMNAFVDQAMMESYKLQDKYLP